jgi:hypothetical protein
MIRRGGDIFISIQVIIIVLNAGIPGAWETDITGWTPPRFPDVALVRIRG